MLAFDLYDILALMTDSARVTMYASLKKRFSLTTAISEAVLTVLEAEEFLKLDPIPRRLGLASLLMK